MPATKPGNQASYLPTAAAATGAAPRAGPAQSAAPPSSDENVSLQQTQYRPGSPIRFYVRASWSTEADHNAWLTSVLRAHSIVCSGRRGKSPECQRSMRSRHQADFHASEQVERMKREVDKTAPRHRRDARRELRARPRRAKPGITLTGFLLRAATLYVLIAYFLVCPNEPNSDRAVCRALTGTSDQLRQYEPYVRPYVKQAQAHLEPYWAETHKHVRPYLDLVAPHYRKADRFARPHLATVVRLYHERAVPIVASASRRARALVQPLVIKLSKQYERSIAPSIEWYSESLSRKYAPQLAHADAFRRETVVPAFRNSLQAVRDAAESGQHHWQAHLVPFTRRAYSSSRQIYLHQVHPRVITVSRQAARVWRTRVSPTLVRFWSRFIAPQLDKIRERIFEYKSKKAQVEAAARVEKASVEIARDQERAEVEGESSLSGYPFDSAPELTLSSDC